MYQLKNLYSQSVCNIKCETSLFLKLKSQAIAHQTAPIGTYIKVGSSVFQDELSGVRLVFTVVYIHLELISLNRGNNISTSLTRNNTSWLLKESFKKNV